MVGRRERRASPTPSPLPPISLGRAQALQTGARIFRRLFRTPACRRHSVSAPAIQGARPTCVALGQAASASPRVAPVLQRRALARRGGIAGSSNDQAAPTLGARSFRRAQPTSIALVQMPVTCHRITVVGKWRPNDSFKGKPLRGFRHPSGSLGGLPLIQVLGPTKRNLEF